MSIGLFSIYHHLSTLIDYLLHPGILRLIWYPYHFLIIQTVIGILLIIAGISILRGGKIFQKLFLLIGYFYLIVPFSDSLGELLITKSNLYVACYLYLLIVYLLISLPLLIYGNLKRFHILRETRSILRINLIMLLCSVIINGLFYFLFGNFSILC